MTTPTHLRHQIRALVFDQYGTVVDMQGGLVAAAAPWLAGKGWTGKPNSFLTWWRRTHFENSMIDALSGMCVGLECSRRRPSGTARASLRRAGRLSLHRVQIFLDRRGGIR